MISHKDDSMGRFSVEVELANNDDMALVRRGLLPPQDVRRVTISGVVDSGATRLVIPVSVVEALDLPILGQTGIRFTDGRRGDRNVASGVHLTWGGRSDVFSAVVEPGRDDALIGAIVLEDLDLIVDCGKQKLVPRDPSQIISEIE